MKSQLLHAVVALLICSTIMAGDCITGSCGCDSGFAGNLGTYWPDAGVTYAHGVLFDTTDNGTTTWFNFNGRDYFVPDYAMLASHVNYETCTFAITYNADAIFRDTEAAP